MYNIRHQLVVITLGTRSRWRLYRCDAAASALFRGHPRRRSPLSLDAILWRSNISVLLNCAIWNLRCRP